VAQYLQASVGASSYVDKLVELAHAEPTRAEPILARSPSLATEPSSWGESCLEAAGHLGHWRLLLRLMEAGVRLDLYAECSLGEPASATAAVRAHGGELLGIHNLPILHFAVMSRDLSVVEALLQAGAPVSSSRASLSPLHSAVACGQAAMAERLLGAGADPLAQDAFGCSAIDWAIQLYGEDCPLARLLARAALVERR